jgi:hypothetical protein
MSDRLHKALLDMADPAKKLAEALAEYRMNLAMGRTDPNAQTIMGLLEQQGNDAISALRKDIVEYTDSTSPAGLIRLIQRTRERELREMGFTFDGSQWWIGDYGTDLSVRLHPKSMIEMHSQVWEAWKTAVTPQAEAWAKQRAERNAPAIPTAPAHILTTTTEAPGLPKGTAERHAAEFIDRITMQTIHAKADELLHAIDLAGQSLKSAIALQTLDLVRGKVKDVLPNLAGTIEKDL